VKKEESKIYNTIINTEFSNYLDDSTIHELSKIMSVVDYNKSDYIYVKNEKILKFLIIHSGICEVIDNDGNVIRKLRENDFFGLISLFTNASKNYDLISVEDTRIFELDKGDLIELTLKFPNIKKELLNIVNEKIFNPEINAAIGKIAKEVDQKSIDELKKDISWKTLNDSEILFNEGDAGDSCYIVMSGRAEAIKNYGKDNEIILGELKKGDIIGDMALITGEKRSATIKASKLSRLIYISKKSFDKVMYNNPKALMEVSKALINRLKYKDPKDTLNKNIIVGIVSLINDKNTQNFFTTLNNSLKSFGSIEDLNEITINLDSDKENLDFDILLENIISNNDFLILHSVDTNNLKWKKNIIKYSDQVIILGDPVKLNNISNEESEIFDNYSKIKPNKFWLVLNHNEDTIIPSKTKKIISIRNGIKTFHVKNNNSNDIRRLARFITKQTIGLTLGGGGAKGFAHYGIYKAMNELNIPIDVIGGTSAGAIIASQIALGYSLNEIININKKVNALKMFKEYGFPYMSLIKSYKVEQAAKISAGDSDIEDLWIPFFAPATDLTNSKLLVFDKGPLWEAIRSSGALPGIVLPHFMDKNIIVDGGLMNNLPVDIMKNNYGGKIICSSCSLDKSMKTSITGIPNQFKLLMSKLFDKTNFEKNYHYVPTITDIVFKTSVVASASQIDENINMSDLFLELPTSEFGLTEMNDNSMMKLIDVGYEYSKPKLQEFKDTLVL